MATGDDVRRVAITREGQQPCLIIIEQSKPLAAVIEQVCKEWHLPNQDKYALAFCDTTTHYFITERTRREIQNGLILQLVPAAGITAQEIIDHLTASASDKVLASLRQLSDLSVDNTFAQEFIQRKGLNILISKIESTAFAGEALACTLKAFVELMDHGIVSWDIIEPRFIKTVSNPVIGTRGGLNDATTLQSALEILESVILHSEEKYAIVEQEVTPLNLVHHLTSSNSDIQKNVLALINALFLKADSNRKKTIAENIQAKSTRNIILTNVIRAGVSTNSEMSHQLYVLQSLLFALLKDRHHRVPDLSDQNCLREINELRKIAFDSDSDSSPAAKQKNFSKDYKKLGFTNLNNPVEDFTKSPPGLLALECMLYFAKMQGENYTRVVLENSCRADDHDLPFARASIELCVVLLEILKVGEQPSEEGQQYQPMFFTNDRPYEEFYANCIHLLNKTWREMRATTADFTKVLGVVKEQITRALEHQPPTFEEFRKQLAKLSFAEISKIWKQERHHKEEWELQAKPIVELREEIKPEIMELIKQQRLNFLVEGTMFHNKHRGGKVRHSFCRLSPNHKVFYYGDCEDENSTPSIELLSNKLPVVEIKGLKTGKDCPHVERKGKGSVKQHLAFSIESESDNMLNLFAPDDNTFMMWTDGINALLGNPMVSESTKADLETLLGMEIKLRLLETEGITIPENPPPIPPPPPNYNFYFKEV